MSRSQLVASSELERFALATPTRPRIAFEPHPAHWPTIRCVILVAAGSIPVCGGRNNRRQVVDGVGL
jgi:hypothetical protein